MTKEEFKYLCDTYSNKKLPTDKKWLAICKITVKDTQRYAVYMLPYYLLGSKYDDSMEEPAFVLLTHKTSDVFNVVTNNDIDADKMLTIIPLSSIRSITFDDDLNVPDPVDEVEGNFMQSSPTTEEEEYLITFSYPPNEEEKVSLYGTNLTSNPDYDIDIDDIDDYIVKESGD